MSGSTRHRWEPAPTAGVSRTRVAVVDRHLLVAEAIGRTLVPRYRAVPVPLPHLCPTADARNAALRTRAAVAVVQLPADGVVDPLMLVAELVDRGVGVVVAGEPPADESMDDYAAVGARCIRSPRPQIAELLAAIDDELERLAATGRHALPLAPEPRHGARVSLVEDPHRPRAYLGRLSPAESRILWALMQGHCAEDIAREKVLSVATVRTQIAQVLRKLEVRSQLSAVALAWEAGWNPEPAAVA